MATTKKKIDQTDSTPWKAVRYDGKDISTKNETYDSYAKAATAARAHERETGEGATAIRS